MANSNIEFGQELRKLVKNRGMKYITLAHKMEVSAAYVSQLLTGVRKPGRVTLMKLSNSLDVPIDILMRFASEKQERFLTTRKVPVLEPDKIIQWLNESDSPSPSLLADTFEYAITDDPQAFYVRTKDLQPCNPAERFDLVQIEPSAAIDHGDTVLVLSADGFSLKKYVVNDGSVILFDVKYSPIFFSKDSDNGDMRLLRAKQCIKKF